ncbi:pectate lyase [Stagonosporopsis vannaccii]|nr:pectate lyase [Stagonosporopsis vannaccii]
MHALVLVLCFDPSAAQSLSFAVDTGAPSGLPSSCTWTSVGGKNVLDDLCTIPAGAYVNLGGREWDRGLQCDERDNGVEHAVFKLGSGATIRNGIIGSEQSEGIHCDAGCTIRDIWFRDICEGGGAQSAGDKVVQANGRGDVIIRDYTVVDIGKVYRSCGNCGSNQQNSPRTITIENLRARNVQTNVVGINSNFGDITNVSGMCGIVSGEICQQSNGVNGGNSDGISGKDNSRGAQGAIGQSTLPRC